MDDDQLGTRGHSDARRLPHDDPFGTGKREIEVTREPNRIMRVIKMLGPGLVTGASDDDPSGIASYAIAGASFGFSTLWTALFTLPMMTAVQLTCAKIGMASGMGISGALRKYYPRFVLYPVVLALLVANTINIGADIGAIAAGVNLILPIPVRFIFAPVTLLIMVLLFVGSYRFIANTFKWLSLALFAYIGASILAKPDWMEVLRGAFIPSFSADPTFIATLVAILGTTISPYLFFWQASQEVEEEVDLGRVTVLQRRGVSPGELRYALWDVSIGMFISNLVMFFIITATAATLFKAGKNDIESASDVAIALQPIAGNAAGLLLALGLIGTGFLAVPVLAGASSYAVAEALGWVHGLNQRPLYAKQFYILIAGSMILGMMINFTGINPIRALFWAAVINGLTAPVLLVMIIIMANNRAIMGQHVNGFLTNVMNWIAAIVMCLAAIALVFSFRPS